MTSTHEKIYDYIVIGSGFGGSVSALRLAEKGYSVLVLEAGRRFSDDDFPKDNRAVRKWLHWPRMGFHGIMRMELFRDAFFLAGAGVGGGSLVYANTLLRPPEMYFKNGAWGKLGDWQKILEPHFSTAERMLGVTKNPFLGPADHALKNIARDMGRADTFHQTQVGVYFGEANKTVDDPYFNGQGPERTGCTLCGNCMVGCRVGAKNTLMKNYLYFAEKWGAVILPETKVTTVRENANHGYTVTARIGMNFFSGGREVSFQSRGIVFSAGVLGTVKLLLKMKHEGHLPKLSNAIGNYVRTNSEALVGMRAKDRGDFSRGIAICSGFYPNEKTHVEVVRYGKNSDAIGLISTLLVGGGPWFVRWAKYFWRVLTQPINFLKIIGLKNWARETVILLVMQNIDNHMKLTFERRWYWPFKKVMTTKIDANDKVPVHIPIANEVATKLAKHFDGIAMGSVPEILLNKTTTAHILGGAVMGENAYEGVIDQKNRVFGYNNMYVVDGSMIPMNLGVNPSLTITAMAEHAMSHINEKCSVKNPLKAV